MDRSRFIRTILIPLVVGIAATALVAWYIKSEEKRLAPDDVLPVIVASRPITAKTILTPDMLKSKTVPRVYSLPGTLARVDEAVGKVTTVALAEGEPLFADRVVQKDKAVGLSYYIPQGLRAVTIAVNEIIGTAAFPEPGDAVDILATFTKEIGGRDRTDLILESVPVLAVVRDTESKGGQFQKDLRSYTSLTLAVTPQEAAKLVWSEEKGKLRVMLRSNGSRDHARNLEANSQTVIGYTKAEEPKKVR